MRIPPVRNMPVQGGAQPQPQPPPQQPDFSQSDASMDKSSEALTQASTIGANIKYKPDEGIQKAIQDEIAQMRKEIEEYRSLIAAGPEKTKKWLTPERAGLIVAASIVAKALGAREEDLGALLGGFHQGLEQTEAQKSQEAAARHSEKVGALRDIITMRQGGIIQSLLQMSSERRAEKSLEAQIAQSGAALQVDVAKTWIAHGAATADIEKAKQYTNTLAIESIDKMRQQHMQMLPLLGPDGVVDWVSQYNTLAIAAADKYRATYGQDAPVVLITPEQAQSIARMLEMRDRATSVQLDVTSSGAMFESMRGIAELASLFRNLAFMPDDATREAMKSSLAALLTTYVQKGMPYLSGAEKMEFISRVLPGVLMATQSSTSQEQQFRLQKDVAYMQASLMRDELRLKQKALDLESFTSLMQITDAWGRSGGNLDETQRAALKEVASRTMTALFELAKSHKVNVGVYEEALQQGNLESVLSASMIFAAEKDIIGAISARSAADAKMAKDLMDTLRVIGIQLGVDYPSMLQGITDRFGPVNTGKGGKENK